MILSIITIENLCISRIPSNYVHSLGLKGAELSLSPLKSSVSRTKNWPWKAQLC